MAELPKLSSNWIVPPPRRKEKRRSRKVLVVCLCIVLLVSFFATLSPTCAVRRPLPLVTIGVDKERPKVAVEKAKELYSRTPDNAYLTFPEWFIVFSSQEYASCITESPPSTFPYFGSIVQYWRSYAQVSVIDKKQYGFNVGDHVMLVVIGGSYSVEMAIKGLYENTVGRLTELINGTDTEEDRFAQAAYTRYVNYIPTYPFYQYSYFEDLKGLWAKTSIWGPHPIRKWERKLVLSAEYGTKAVYTSLIEYLTHALYGVEGQDTYVELRSPLPEISSLDPRVRVLAETPGALQTTFPRYQAFTEVAVPLARSGVVFENIAGNANSSFVTLSVLVDRQFNEAPSGSQVLFSMDVLTQPQVHRLMLKVPVSSLSTAIVFIEAHHGVVEHIFDY